MANMSKLFYRNEEKLLEDENVVKSNIIRNFDEASRRLNVAETGTIKIGKDSNTGGINRANVSTDIIFWAGDTQENRTIAPYRIDAAGNLTATSATITGSYITYTVGDITLVSNSAENSMVGVTYTKVKENNIGRGTGALRLSWQMRHNGTNGVDTVFGTVYRNGSAVGTEKSTTNNTFTTVTDDVSGWSSGDLIQIFLKTNAGGISGLIQNFNTNAANSIIPVVVS